MTLPGWVGVREPWGRLGGRYAKNVTICPTLDCTTPTVTAVSQQQRDEVSPLVSIACEPSYVRASHPSLTKLARADDSDLPLRSRTVFHPLTKRFNLQNLHVTETVSTDHKTRHSHFKSPASGPIPPHISSHAYSLLRLPHTPNDRHDYHHLRMLRRMAYI